MRSRHISQVDAVSVSYARHDCGFARCHPEKLKSIALGFDPLPTWAEFLAANSQDLILAEGAPSGPPQYLEGEVPDCDRACVHPRRS